MAAGLFNADNGLDGRELWFTDGTPEGTRLLVDLWPGGGGSNPSSLVPLGDGRVVFAASDPEFGNEPWISDGTTAGTQRIADLNRIQSGFGSSSPSGFVAFGEGRAFFPADDGLSGREPWATDGSAEGTVLLGDLASGSSDGSNFGSFPGAVAALEDGRLLFGASSDGSGRSLWITDGTPDGTLLLRADLSPGSPGSAASLGDGRVMFAAFETATGSEPWVSDGTAAGTVLLADILPGESSSSPGSFVALADGRVMFPASDPALGRELWVSDGTVEGTRLLVDIRPGQAGGVSSGSGVLTPVGGRALFAANEGERGAEPWISDGTAEGTYRVADIWPGGGSSNPANFAPLGDGRAVFTATDPVHGNELWITDLTEAGTRLLADINPNQRGFASGNVSNPVPIGDGLVLFAADDGVSGREPWVTDGTAEGTQRLLDVNPGLPSSAPGGFAPVALPEPPAPPEDQQDWYWYG